MYLQSHLADPRTIKSMQALAPMFKLPPFPLARLEAAVLPGPHSFDFPKPASIPQQPSKESRHPKEEPEGQVAVAEPAETAVPDVEPGKPLTTAEEEQEAAAKPVSKPSGKKKGKRQATRKSSARQSKAGGTAL